MGFLFQFTAGVFAVLILAQCTYKKPETIVPPPDQQVVPKSFFVGNEWGKPIQAAFQQRDTFICGWAAISEMGSWNQHLGNHNVKHSDLCNIKFDITEEALIGYRVNPNYPDDFSRWQVTVRIPIKDHFYLERERDEKGREKNKIGEVSDRSEKVMRSHMRLDLAKMAVETASFDFMGWAPRIVAVEDVEWDHNRRFLGFTVVVSDAYYKHHIQSRYRVNFLKAQPSHGGLAKTPFDLENFKYVNPTMVMKESIQGRFSSYYVGKWDLTKTHDFYLHGFPQEYKQIAYDIVADWNKSLADVGAVPVGHKPFRVIDQQPRHTFDLRYPMFVWVDDQRRNFPMYSGAPLGYVQTQVNVTTGHMEWAHMVIFGRTIEEYLLAYSSKDQSGVARAAVAASQIQFPSFENMLNKISKEWSLELPGFDERYLQSLESQLTTRHFTPSLQEAGQRRSVLGTAQLDAQAAMGPGLSAESLRVPNSVLKSIQEIWKEQSQYFLKPKIASTSEAVQRMRQAYGWTTDPGQEGEIVATPDPALDASFRTLNGNTFCLDRTFDSMSDGLASALSSQLKAGRSLRDLTRVFVKFTMSHEFGHIVGLHHNFKENILPDADTVPAPLYAQMKKDAKEGRLITALMGYYHPRVKLKYEYEEVVPAAQDLMNLRFIYKQEAPYYKKGNENYTYRRILPDGQIPKMAEDDASLKLAFLPQCNDRDSQESISPFCAWHDRGSTPLEIVQGYLEDLEEMVARNRNNFVSEYRDTWSVLYGIYMRSFHAIGRVRIFYDYMRRKYADVFETIRKNERMILDLGRACEASPQAVAERFQGFVPIFEKYPEFKELCHANKIAIEKLGEWAGTPGADFINFNFDEVNTYMYRDPELATYGWGRRAQWSEMTLLPVKLAATYALSSPVPWTVINRKWIVPAPMYNDASARFLYSSFYPEQYTAAISNLVSGNLQLKQGARKGMGWTILSYALVNLFESSMTNDVPLLPRRLVHMVKSQTDVSVEVVALVVTGRKKEGSPHRVESFSGEVYQFRSGKSLPASEVYVLPGGYLLAKAENMFLFSPPGPRLRFVNNEVGIQFMYKIEFSHDPENELSKYGVQTVLSQAYGDVFSSCTMGDEVIIDEKTGQRGLNGLAHYFTQNSAKGFEGFYLPSGIAGDKEKEGDFLRSVTEQFEKYYTTEAFGPNGRPDRERCQDAMVGLDTIATAAALVSGIPLPGYLEKIQK